MLLYKYQGSGNTSVTELAQEIWIFQSSYQKNHTTEISGLVADSKIIFSLLEHLQIGADQRRLQHSE